MTTTDDPHGPCSVWRQDDHGHETKVRSGLSATAAERLVAELEAGGHKQIYWVTTEDVRPSAAD